MQNLFKRIRQLVLPRGVWVTYHIDFSGFAFFEDELFARRYAADNGMSVDFVPFGEDVRLTILRR